MKEGLKKYNPMYFSYILKLYTYITYTSLWGVSRYIGTHWVTFSAVGEIYMSSTLYVQSSVLYTLFPSIAFSLSQPQPHLPRCL